MRVDIIQAKYDELDAIAQNFGRQADIAQAMQQQILTHFEPLEDGGWIGRGSHAFFGEMRNDIFPALERLHLALSEARAVTLEASRLFRQAEQEAAQPFREQHGAPQGRSGVSGGGGGGGGGGGYGTNNAGTTFTYQEGGLSARWQGDLSVTGVIEWANNKTESELGFRYGIVEGEFRSKQASGSTSFGELEATGTVTGKIGEFDVGVQVGIGENGLPTAGVGGEISLASASVQGVVGDENFGVTGEAEVNVLKGEGFIGIKDGSFDATLGAKLISAQGEVGTNIAGVNVGLTGEVGLKAEIGIKLGPTVELKLPFVTVGFSIGRAKDGK